MTAHFSLFACVLVCALSTGCPSQTREPASHASTEAQFEAQARAEFGDEVVNDLLAADAAQRRGDIGASQVVLVIQEYMTYILSVSALHLKKFIRQTAP